MTNLNQSGMKQSKSMKSIKKSTSLAVGKKGSLIQQEPEQNVVTNVTEGDKTAPEDNSPNFIKRRKSVLLTQKDPNPEDTLYLNSNQDDEERQEKEKLKPRRVSKYTQVVNQTSDPEYEEKMRNLLKEYTTNGTANIAQEVKKDQRLSLFQYSKLFKMIIF